jgi:NAD(P)-dependent dehydrogenase (short-subunit alcohol dehydrogenase family)
LPKIKNMGLRLNNKVAVVTGAGSGLGRASAIAFASEGAKVVCADCNADAAGEVVEEIQAAGGVGLAVMLDAASPEDNERLVAEAQGRFGHIDILLANAGIPSVGSLTDVDFEDWQRVIAVNLTGVWLANKAVIPVMQAQGGGSIINQASITALVGFAGVAAYSAAKGGVVALTRQAAVEYAEEGIRVNAICPGTIVTPLVTQTYVERGGVDSKTKMPLNEALTASAQRYPMKRLGDVEDVANLAVFLASDESRWITGAVMPVDGGYTAA